MQCLITAPQNHLLCCLPVPRLQSGGSHVSVSDPRRVGVPGGLLTAEGFVFSHGKTLGALGGGIAEQMRTDP